MGILLFAIVIVLFVLGFSRAIDLAAVLKDAESRRSFLLRIAGFLAMSLWLHQLPSMLLLVYMRHEGILASEMLSEDVARATVVGTYAMFVVAFLVLFACVGALDAFTSKKPFQWNKLSTLAGYAVTISLLVIIGFTNNGWARAAFFLAVVLVFSFYVHLTLLTPLDKQVRLYPIPFFVIILVTLTVFTQSNFTHEMVGGELRKFRSGGGTDVYVKHKEGEIAGSLVLLTKSVAYVRSGWTRDLERNDLRDGCVVRVPLEGALVAHRPFIHDTAEQLDGQPKGDADYKERIKLKNDIDALCGTALQDKSPAPKVGTAASVPASGVSGVSHR